MRAPTRRAVARPSRAAASVRCAGSLVIAALWLAWPAAAHQNEIERPCAEGASSQLVYSGLARNPEAINENLPPPNPCALPADGTDRYPFEGTQGDIVRVALTNLSQSFEPRLEVVGPSQQALVDSQACSGQPAICGDVQELGPLPETGTYEIRISSTDEGGDFDFYWLQLDRLDPASYDPDDITFQAGRTEYEDFAELRPHSDVDHWGIEVTTDELRQIDLTVMGLPGLDYEGLDPRVTLRSPSGALIAEASCEGGGRFDDPCSLSMRVPVSGAGVYAFTVADEGADERGVYGLAWSIPEPGAAPGVAAALAILAGLSRSRRRSRLAERRARH